MKLNNQGMATVEVCVIVPIILGITMLLIWFGIYSYDSVVCSRSVDIATTYAAETPELENKELCKICESKLEKELKDNLILLNNVETTVNVNLTQIDATVSGEFNLLKAFNMGSIYNNDMWTINVSGSAPRLNHSLVVRTVERIKKSKK